MFAALAEATDVAIELASAPVVEEVKGEIEVESPLQQAAFIEAEGEASGSVR